MHLIYNIFSYDNWKTKIVSYYNTVLSKNYQILKHQHKIHIFQSQEIN